MLGMDLLVFSRYGPRTAGSMNLALESFARRCTVYISPFLPDAVTLGFHCFSLTHHVHVSQKKEISCSRPSRRSHKSGCHNALLNQLSRSRSWKSQPPCRAHAGDRSRDTRDSHSRVCPHDHVPRLGELGGDYSQLASPTGDGAGATYHAVSASCQRVEAGGSGGAKLLLNKKTNMFFCFMRPHNNREHCPPRMSSCSRLSRSFSRQYKELNMAGRQFPDEEPKAEQLAVECEHSEWAEQFKPAFEDAKVLNKVLIR